MKPTDLAKKLIELRKQAVQGKWVELHHLDFQSEVLINTSCKKCSDYQVLGEDDDAFLLYAANYAEKIAQAYIQLLMEYQLIYSEHYPGDNRTIDDMVADGFKNLPVKYVPTGGGKE